MCKIQTLKDYTRQKVKISCRACRGSWQHELGIYSPFHSLLMLYVCGLLRWESTSFSRTDENQMIPKMVTSILESTKFQITALTLILLSTKLHPKPSTGQHPKHPLGKYKSNIIRARTVRHCPFQAIGLLLACATH